MSIPLWPDWNRLYEEWKCLDRGIPFTDEQQEQLFALKWQTNYEAKKWELIRKWRADAEAKKLEDPKQLQAKANAVAIKGKLDEMFLNKKEELTWKKEKPTEEKTDGEVGTTDKVDYSSMSYNDLKALAKEKWIELKNPKKDDLIKALEEAGE